MIGMWLAGNTKIRPLRLRIEWIENNVPLVKAENVNIYFHGKNRKQQKIKAVDGINLEIGRNEIFGVVGESGCGKSTLGRGLIGLLPLTGGTVSINGKNISELNKKEMKQMREKVQIIFQDPSASLNPRRKVKDILMEPFKVHGMRDKQAAMERIYQLLDLVGLAEYHLQRYPHELSGGQKQRIGIARALALEPELIICDEAVSALDVSVQAQVLNLLTELKEKLGLTYFFISHNLNVVYQISDRVAVMYLGKIVELASYDGLYEHRYHPYTEALLSAIPQVEKEQRQERIILKSDIPHPGNPPEGCPFHPRCFKSLSKCRSEVPPIHQVEPGHWVSCHLYGKDK